MHLLPLLLLLLLIPSSLAQPPPPPPAAAADEARSLLEFRKGISLDPSGLVLSSWSSASPCSWHGVSCDSGSVVSCDSLSGDLKFTTLSPLRSLRNLSLSGNLVPAIGALSSLARLDLSRNRFSDLTALSHLNLSANAFSETIPPAVQNLQQLRTLDLSANALRGDAAALLSSLRYTEHLDLSGNAFSGALDFGSANLSLLGDTLRYMNLSNNKLASFLLNLHNNFGQQHLICIYHLFAGDNKAIELEGASPQLEGASPDKFQTIELEGASPQTL